uniref:NB-ARC domain-containing protein n=1 Tax=Setaria italica TaxID=4555 RepID=K4A045_SETIT
MESFISAILGELTTRSINFFISKLSKPTTLDVEDRLRRVLLRAQVIIDEAKGRHITNQAMLLQLVMLRDAVHWSHYVLDTFRCQLHQDEEGANNQGVSRSSSLSKVNSAMRLYSRGAKTLKDLQGALDNLSSMILDVNELVLFLTNYPCLYRQPYSMHLQLANFINFLLHVQPHGADEELEVLPIVGPSYVGKSTLVAHVCKDERVRARFSEILFFHIQTFTDDELATFRYECELKHQNRVSESNLEARLLVVIELIGDLINEEAWGRLYSASKRYAPRGSKIIVTSRFDSIVKFGTTRALTLKFLPHEAYWYFFKTLTFGSMDPEMHPRLTHLAMEIAKMLYCYFIGANIMASLLRDNFDVQFWCKIVAFLRGFFHKHVSRFGEHPFDLLNQNRPAHLRRLATPSQVFVIYHQYQCSRQDKVPKIRFQDVMYGTFKTSGKFEFLSWRSSIPPYHSFAGTCEILELKAGGAKRKRSMKDGDTLR